MGSKSARREARTAAARERDGELFRRGTSDESTRAHLRSLGQHRFNEVVGYAAAVASRPMGAAAALMRDQAERSINERRAAMGKDPLIDGHLTVEEYAEKNRAILNEGQAELLVSEACP